MFSENSPKGGDPLSLRPITPGEAGQKEKPVKGPGRTSAGIPQVFTLVLNVLGTRKSLAPFPGQSLSTISKLARLPPLILPTPCCYFSP